MEERLLQFRGLAKRRFEQHEVYIFQDLSAEVAEGQRIALLGASGQGKSTLLRMLARLESADEGTMELLGRPAAEWEPPLWRQHIGYVAQQPVMLPGTVGDNLRTASRLHGRPFEETLAKRLMEQIGLAHIDWEKAASDLSGGEKQRIALVRSLLLRPKLLLLDETTSSLDPSSKSAAQGLLLDWCRQEGAAQLWVTHDLNQAREVSGEVWYLEAGRLSEKAETERFFTAPATEAASRFIRSAEPDSGGEVQVCPTSR